MAFVGSKKVGVPLKWYPGEPATRRAINVTNQDNKEVLWRKILTLIVESDNCLDVILVL